ncbi:hypothetical protein BR93DRAFT_14270 [Coniochaeta sp. PMI_546]|nr:hypothetical protein BR93DRAFT_14270 [Coniochaeta sp. PMI_546]
MVIKVHIQGALSNFYFTTVNHPNTMLAIIPSLLLALSLQNALVHGLVITSSSEPITTTIHLPTAPLTLYSGSTTGPEPEITSGPDPTDLSGDDPEAAARFVQTTYWSCVKLPGVSTAHCGWHEPIIDASMPSAGRCVRVESVSMVMAAVVVVLFLLLLV